MRRKHFTFLFIFSLILALALSAASAMAQTSSALWFVSYYDNPDLEGSPVYQTSEGSINHDWGTDAPAPGAPHDQWSARWTAFVDFDPGTYRFTVTSDDGVGVFLGDKHIISDFKKQPETTNIATVSLHGGTYPMAVDYFDDVGRAVLKVSWERIGAPVAGAADVTIVSSGPAQPPAPAPQGAWRAVYWNNTSLQGTPALERDEPSINHNWGMGSPSSAVNADNFSARWTNNLNLIPGRYRFTVSSDDGARLWLNEQLRIDRWFDHPAETQSVEIDWPGGVMPVRLEYYEHTHFAQIQLSWTRLGAAPDTGGQPTATVTAYWLNVRTGPGTNNSIITTIPANTVLTLIGRNDDASWVQVILPDGQQGWVSSAYIATNYPLSDLAVG